jgi:hypothetical protein
MTRRSSAIAKDVVLVSNAVRDQCVGNGVCRSVLEVTGQDRKGWRGSTSNGDYSRFSKRAHSPQLRNEMLRLWLSWPAGLTSAEGVAWKRSHIFSNRADVKSVSGLVSFISLARSKLHWAILTQEFKHASIWRKSLP